MYSFGSIFSWRLRKRIWAKEKGTPQESNEWKTCINWSLSKEEFGR